MMQQVFKPAVWWPTPILVVQHPEAASLNQRLASIILQKEREILAKESPTSVAGVDNGLTAYWLKYNVLNWEFPECQAFRELVLNGAREFLRVYADPNDPDYQIVGISCWANVLRRGQSLDIHHHDPGYLSAHYTVQSGQDDSQPTENQCGHTVYFRPGFIERSQGDSAFGSLWDSDWRFSVAPKAGNMTFFPSYVRHEVRPQLGTGERISIAMDIYVKKQQVPFYFAAPRWYVPPR
jgi:uncharacterized protein (TIGR02466 family)